MRGRSRPGPRKKRNKAGVVSQRPLYIIFSRHFDPRSAETYASLARAIVSHGARVGVWAEVYDHVGDASLCSVAERVSAPAVVRSAEALLSVGGDGTFLAAAKMVMGAGVPILGVNRGRLGFLSDVAPEQIHAAIGDLLAGNYRTVEVPVVNMYVDDDRSPIGYAVNEFAITKCDNSSMLTLDTYVDGDYLTTYWSDGLIVSTSTGSTAYSLSVGGPIVVPTVRSLIVTPVAPHNLSIRPLVLPDDVVLNIVVGGRSSNVMASFDGHARLVPCGGRLRIAKAGVGVRRVQLSSYSFFQTLREKLMWGADVRNGHVARPADSLS